MSGIQQMLLGGRMGIVNPFSAYNLFADSAPGISAVASITFQADGVVSSSVINSDAGSIIGSPAWHIPVSTGIGAGFFIRLTPTSGTFTSNDAVGFIALSSNRTATKSATAGTAAVTFTIEISTDIGGTNIVLTSTGNVLRYSHT